MGFIDLCVGLVLVIFIFIVTFLIGKLISFMSDDDEETTFIAAWFFSVLGFGIVLTILLHFIGAI